MQSKGILQIPRNVTATLISALRIKYKYNKYFMEDRRSRTNLSLSFKTFHSLFDTTKHPGKKEEEEETMVKTVQSAYT